MLDTESTYVICTVGLANPLPPTSISMSKVPEAWAPREQMMEVSNDEVMVHSTPSIVTESALVSVPNLVPVMVTLSPEFPLEGDTEIAVGVCTVSYVNVTGIIGLQWFS